MNYKKKKFTLLIANDDEDTRFLVEEALREVRLGIRSKFVENGEQVLEYLYRRGQYVGSSNWHQPDLILLDLNMPSLDGRETLTSIRSGPHLQQIPVVSSQLRTAAVISCFATAWVPILSYPNQSLLKDCLK